MLTGSSQNGTQSVTCLQYAGTRTTRLPVYRQGLNHSLLFEWNMVNPPSRLSEAGCSARDADEVVGRGTLEEANAIR